MGTVNKSTLKMNSSKIHDYKQSTINNSTTIESVRQKKQSTGNDIKQSINATTAKLRK